MEFPKDFLSARKPAADPGLQDDVSGPAFHFPKTNNRTDKSGDINKDHDVEAAGPKEDGEDDTENQPPKEVIAAPENEPEEK